MKSENVHLQRYTKKSSGAHENLRMRFLCFDKSFFPEILLEESTLEKNRRGNQK